MADRFYRQAAETYSPGEWFVEGGFVEVDEITSTIEDAGFVAIRAPDSGYVAFAHPINARLIAAAPDLFGASEPTLTEKAWESLAELVEAFRSTDDTDGDGAAIAFIIDREKRIRAAIAKVEGGE